MKIENIAIGGRQKANPADIICLKSICNYSSVFFSDGRSFMSGTTLKILENRLQKHGFFRINRTWLVNLDFIKSYQSFDKQGKVWLSNNQEIIVSRRRCKSFERVIQNGKES